MNSFKVITVGLIWKILERLSVQGSQFIIQIILARLLSPEHYGALAIMMIFVTLANVIIQNGFNTSLIQNKDVDDDDFSSVFWLIFGISLLVYMLLYAVAPLLADYYGMPYLENPFKVICLMLIPGALNSVQLAIIRRSMDFKKEFTSNLISIVLAGIIGIICAYQGYGLWSLVVQTLLNTSIACITMWYVLGWRPQLVFNISRVKVLLAYGYKLVLAGLLDTFSQDLSAFIIGAKYSSSSLGFFTRGKQFPSAIMGALNSAVQSVMLPALSALQDDKEKAKQLMRKSIVLSTFAVFPMMAVLAGIAKPMVSVVLTDKWLDCVPYIQIFCFSYAFWPVHTNNLQAINAMGRSDIFLRLEVYKKIIGWASLAFAVYYFDDPLAIAGMAIATTVTSSFINCYPNKYLLRYTYIEQMKDLLPYLLLSLATFILMLNVGNYISDHLLSLFVSPLLGIIFYLMMAYFMKLEAFCVLIQHLNKILKKRG